MAVVIANAETSVGHRDRPDFERRLAAVAFADVAGYSRMIEQDDVETTHRWRALRQNLIEPKTAEYRGRVIRMLGDGLFIEFRSAVDAVSWARDIQRAIAEMARSDEPLLQVRIGINVEDVIVDDDDLHGDGVNIAARIHQLANPGDVVMTAAVHDYVWNKIGVVMTDLGEHRLKNISRPIRVFRLEDSDVPQGTPRRPYPHVAWSNRPTIAVLPFRNRGGNPDEEYFGEGITEDIITALARSRSLFVIARNSTLAYRDQRSDPQRVAEDLGVRYLLQGNVRRQGGTLRISTELIDTERGITIWAEKYDGNVEDLFDFQDRIAASIVATIEPRVYEAESVRARSKPTESLDAYDCVLRAFPLFYTFVKKDMQDAGNYLDLALRLDPTYAQAHAYKAWWHVLRLGEGIASDSTEVAGDAEALVQKALSLDDKDAFVLAVAAHVQGFLRKQPELAAEMFERSLLLNENSAFAWGLSAVCCCYLGRGQEAQERLRNAWRLSPFDPLNFLFLSAAGLAEFIEARYDQAIAWLQKSRRQNPRFIANLRTLAACLALDGHEDEAKDVMAKLLEIEPQFRVGQLARWYPLHRSGDLERYLRGLRLAGASE